MSGRGKPIQAPLPFRRDFLNRRAVAAVRRLQKHGFESYLVGGCVRDLLLGSRPKDFDIATSARPEQVRRLFRRARIIGRRFRIVHVHDGRDVFEVATFRRAPKAKEGEQDVRMIRSDNAYGSAKQDANRRDFTVNGLFLDPVREEIVDWVGGLEDCRQGVLHSIGDPEVRFREDPVRILRLIKFMRRLDLEPGEAEIDAAGRHARDLRHAAPARLAEELFRLLATGQAEGVYEDLCGLRIRRYVLPELRDWLQADPSHEQLFRSRLRALDDMQQAGMEVDYDIHLAVLFGGRLESEIVQARDAGRSLEESKHVSSTLRHFQQRARLPRTSVMHAASVLKLQKFLDPEMPRLSRRGPKLRDEHFQLPAFPRALEYLKLRLQASGRDSALHDRLLERLQALQQ